MRVLIDTHVFLWAITDGEPSVAKRPLAVPVADVWMSVASVWEIITKVRLAS